MPIINVPVEPFVQPPYRGKLLKSGGIRRPDDWGRVILNERDKYGCRLVVHDQSLEDNVVFEIHNAYGNGQEIENCTMESFQLNRSQRMELVIYLLSTL